MDDTNHPEWAEIGRKVAIFTPNRASATKVTSGTVAKLTATQVVVTDAHGRERRFRLRFKDYREVGVEATVTLHPFDDPDIVRAMVRQRRASALNAVSTTLNRITKESPDFTGAVIDPGQLDELLEAVRNLIDTNDAMQDAR